MSLFKKMNDTFESEVRGLYKNGIELMYYMRGALSKDEMLTLTAFEREMFAEFLKDRLKEEKEKGKVGMNMVY